MKRSRASRQLSRQAGFSLLEMLTVVAILTLVMGAVFGQIATVQKRYKTEETKLDLVQESREFIDQMVRDLHNVGYPNARMYAQGALTAPTANDVRNAVGLVKFDYNDVWFEGDVDGDGQVDVVRYTLQSVGGSCPCAIRRSQTAKLNATAPMAQNSTSYQVQLENVVNSAGSGGGGVNGSLPIAGNSTVGAGGGGYTTIANDTLYGGYKGSYIFRAFDQNGNAVGPADYSTLAGQQALASIRTIRIVISVLAPATGTDIQTLRRPAVSVTSSARINN